MPERQIEEEIDNNPAKRGRQMFHVEWLTNEHVEAELPSTAPGRRELVLLKEIFTYNLNTGVTCNICIKAGLKNEWTTGKKWDNWKVDYLKRHATDMKSHLDAITRLRSQSKGLLKNMLTQSAIDVENTKETNR